MRYAIEPCPKPRMTRRDKWKKRLCVLRYWAFKDKCRVHRVQLPQPCRVVFHMAMPKSWSAAKREHMDGQPHAAKPDLDNLIKGLWDAILKEDSHLSSVTAEKRWSLKPGIEVEKL